MILCHIIVLLVLVVLVCLALLLVYSTTIVISIPKSPFRKTSVGGVCKELNNLQYLHNTKTINYIYIYIYIQTILEDICLNIINLSCVATGRN